MKLPADFVPEEGERVLWLGKMSWRANLLLIIIGFALIPILVGFILLLLVYLRVIATEYMITTNRVYVKYGLIARNVRDVRMEWIASATVVQSFFGRLLNYGDLLIVTPGEALGSVKMIGIHDPMVVKSFVEEGMKKHKKISELKEALRDLENQRVLGRISQEEYDELRRKIEQEIRRV